ncbi:DUF928 domain-containing protein [Anabaena sp. UHCC 0253]|uniref:DUF928 domain-containing protein n=1 Tax=Anabaena sp. UHCC 0253 TaxID=2590019 RepID=UPI0014477A1D|nr:DUF928 domain-containing protein [Anabaena sp. UHCC 0253]MTJ53145.1 DUF928 domain-containing protein [Anabaena sp. UHCC 0253]
MNFSKYQRTISLAVLMLLGLGSTFPVLASVTVSGSGDRVTKLAQNQEVLLTQTLRRRKPLRFPNLNVKAPNDRKSRFGAVRGGVCQYNQSTTKRNIQKDIIALIPPNSLLLTAQKTEKIQLTTAAHPTVLFYLSENAATTASFYLCKNNTLVYQALDFELPNKTSNNADGIVVLNLADVAKNQDLPELKIGENYRWQIKLPNNPDASKPTPNISGWMRRIDAQVPLNKQLETNISNTVIADELEKVSSVDYPLVYVENGIWYSAINSLLELIQTNPQDPQIRKDWEGLLTSVNLTEIAKKPIIGTATIKDVQLNDE